MMNIKNLTTQILFILFCLISVTAYATDITVKVDRMQVEFNETFTLVFEASESPDNDPDFSPLEKDFQVLGTSTSSNMSIINGTYSRTKKWNVSLIALHQGTITIPSISFGSDSSPSYQIEIKQPQTSTGKQGEALISELEISTVSAYPQQQIIVTQRLLSSSNINAYEFSKLNTRGVEITQESLGEIKQYQTKRGSTPYLVLEQSYAIYPQSAGQLTFEPSVASARITIQNRQRSRSAFDPFGNNTKTLRRSSDTKTVTVKPVPKSFNAKYWLAAKDVQLVEEFPDADGFTVGEPITRTLLLMADGQNASQLPELVTQEVKGLKQYPDKPLQKNNILDTGITGVQQLKVAIIPSAAGQYTLPAMSIAWWNTQTDKLEYAKIPSRTFTAKPATGSASTPLKPPQINIPDNTSNSITADISQPENTLDTPATNTGDDANNSSLLWKIISLLLAISLIITLFLLWKKPATETSTDTQPQINEPSLKRALKDLQQACENDDAQRAKNALLAWGSALFIQQPVNSLADLSARIDDAQLAENLQSLNSFLYRSNTQSWQCGQLHQLCRKFTEKYNTAMKQSDKAGSTDQLESLYK